MVLKDLNNTGLPQTFNMHNTQRLQNTKQGAPVYNSYEKLYFLLFIDMVLLQKIAWLDVRN